MFEKTFDRIIKYGVDELTNETHKTISIKTFVSLCCIFNIPIILVDDDVKTKYNA